MDQFAFFFFKDAFGLAHVDERLQVAAVVVLFLLFTFFSHLVLVATRAIEQSLKRIGEERHERKKRTDNRQQKEQRAFRVARRDEERDELAKDTGEYQPCQEADEHQPRAGRKAQRD